MLGGEEIRMPQAHAGADRGGPLPGGVSDQEDRPDSHLCSSSGVGFSRELPRTRYLVQRRAMGGGEARAEGWWPRIQDRLWASDPGYMADLGERKEDSRDRLGALRRVRCRIIL